MEKILRFIFIFSFTYLVLLWFMPKPDVQTESRLVFSTAWNYTIWDIVEINIDNSTKEDVTFKSSCPNFYFSIERNIQWEKEDITDRVNTEDCSDLVVKAWENKKINLWDNNLNTFVQEGNYKFIAITDNWKEFEATFEVSKPWFFKQYIWNAFIYKPIYNALIFLIKIWPWMSLWFGIIFLTLLIKLILLAPSHKALKGQKAMQKIQPELNKIKEKYKWNQQKIATETMEVWKKHKANPLWSCLPLFIQFPILIAIFFIIRDGLNANSAYLLYSQFATFDYSAINTNFLGILDLTKPNIYVLPLVVWALQFFQMSLSFNGQQVPDKNSWSKDMMQQQMQMMSKMMKYFMPIMIAVFTATLPAAIWIYWWVSTAFAILQQVFINKDDSGTWKQNKKNKDIIDVDVEVVSNTSAKKTKDWITRIKA